MYNSIVCSHICLTTDIYNCDERGLQPFAKSKILQEMLFSFAGEGGMSRHYENKRDTPLNYDSSSFHLSTLAV